MNTVMAKQFAGTTNLSKAARDALSFDGDQVREEKITYDDCAWRRRGQSYWKRELIGYAPTVAFDENSRDAQAAAHSVV